MCSPKFQPINQSIYLPSNLKLTMRMSALLYTEMFTRQETAKRFVDHLVSCLLTWQYTNEKKKQQAQTPPTSPKWFSNTSIQNQIKFGCVVKQFLI